MIFSTTAVRSLSSLLVFAMAASTPSVVGGATTMNRKLNKNSPTVTPTMKCRTATLYYPLAKNNTLGSPHINQAFPGPSPLGEGEEKICLPNNTAVCIGDTFINSNTLYADPALTQQVAKLYSQGTVVNLNVGGGGSGLATSSIFYEDTKAELIYGGTGAVFGGTQECALASGTIDLSSASGDNYGSVEFHLVA
jgi:hypothetical protein